MVDVELRLVKTMPKEKHFSEEYFNERTINYGHIEHLLKFYEGYVIKNSGTRPLLQTLSRVNLNPISVPPAQNDTNFPQSILGLYF